MRSGRYVVELELDGDYPDVRRVSSRAVEAAEAVSAEGLRVRFVRTVFVPEDGVCLLVFEAAGAAAARAAASRAGLRIARVSPALKTT